MVSYILYFIKGRDISQMKLLNKLLTASLAAIISTAVCAHAKDLTLNFSIPDNGAIVIPETARFNIFTNDGVWLGNSACEIFGDTREATVTFDVPEEETLFKITPTKGVTEVRYLDDTYSIDEEIIIDTSSDPNPNLTATPLFEPKTGIRCDSVTIHLDVLDVGTPLESAARFNLFDEDGQWLANNAVWVQNAGERKSLTFYVPQYYTGKKFLLSPTVGMASVNYNGIEYMPYEMIELETFATVRGGFSITGDFFHLNLTPIVKEPEPEPESTDTEDAEQTGEAATASEPTPALVESDNPFAAEATAFVNASGVGSKTDYLIWISKKDFKVSVFLGEAGNWRFVDAFDCSIGAPSTPTITGQFEYFQYQSRWSYPTYYVGPVMRFAPNGYAMHSTLLRYNGTPADGRLRKQISHGCVRLAPYSINWLASYIPLHTRVYITN